VTLVRELVVQVLRASDPIGRKHPLDAATSYPTIMNDPIGIEPVSTENP
jgi:hypothetical protein